MAAKKPDYSGGENVVSAGLVLTDIAGTPTPATGKTLTNAKTLDVSIVDGSGNQVTTFGGGTEYADGAARGAATGGLVMGDDGVNIQSIKVDTSGVLAIQDNAGSITVDGTFFQATQPVSLATNTPDVTDRAGRAVGVVSAANLDVAMSTRLKPADTLAAVTSITNVVHIDDNAGSLTVDGTVTTSPPANASTNVAQLAGTATSVNSGNKDAGTLRVVLATDQPALTNKLLVTPDSVALPANQSVNVNQVGGAAVVTVSAGLQKVGVIGNAGGAFDAATAAAVPANALSLGARAATANPVNATGGNLVGIMSDKAGRLVVTNAHARDLVAHQQTTVAVNTETTIVGAGGLLVFNDLVQLIITTAGAAAQTITIKDGTAGTTRMVLNYPNAALAPGAPLIINFDPPMPQGASNGNWTVTQSLATACNYTARYVKNL